MSCCNNTYRLGCFNHCNVISFGTATNTATLTGIFTFAGINTAVNIPIVTGQPYSVNLTSLNENAEFSLRLFNNDGSVHSITISDTSYDCFSFKTLVVYNSTSTTPGPSECCASTLIAVTDESAYVITAAQWTGYGTIPTVEVFIKDEGAYKPVLVQPTYDQFPNPTTITVTLGDIPADVWYIKLS